MAIDVGLWNERIQNCIDLQSQHTGTRKEIIRLFTSQFYARHQGSQGLFASLHGDFSELNFLYEYLKVKKATIFSRSPFIFSRSRTSNFTEFAETIQTVINYYWRELKAKPKFKDVIDEGILVPPGWIEIGFTGQLQKAVREVLEEEEEEFTPETKPLSKVESQLGILDETIKNADVFLRYVAYTDVVWPDGYNNIREAPYIVRIERTKLAEVINNPLYNEKKNEIKGTQGKSVSRLPKLKTFKSNVPISRDTTKQEDLTDVILYHVWDKRSRTRFTIPDGSDFTIFEKSWDTLTEGFTLYPLLFTRIPPTDTESNSYPLSDVIPMLPQLRDLHIINTAILRHGKRHGTLIITKKGTYDDDELKKIQSAPDVALIELESISEADLITFNTPSLPADWYRIRDLIIQDLFRISGFQQLLGSQKGIETATESENAKAGELLRTSDAVDTMEDFTVEVARGLAGLIWQFVQRKRISEIVNEPVTEKMWPTLPEDLDEARRIVQQEIFFRIDAGSMQPPKNEAVERKQWIDTITTVKTLFPSKVNDDVVLAQLLKKLEFKDIEQAIRTNDDVEVQVAQRENELLLKGNEIPVSPNENHLIHLQVHSQVEQVQGLPKTPQFDQHLLQHQQFFEAEQPTVQGQRQKTTPQDTKRKGVPDVIDLVGGATNTNRGTGLNTAR